MAAADADEAVALAQALADADELRGAADVVHAQAVEPLNEARTNSQTARTRSYAEGRAARASSRALVEAQAYRLLDIGDPEAENPFGYTLAAKIRAVDEATADKPYWVGYFGLAPEETDDELAHARDIGYAAAGLHDITTRGQSDVAWVTGFMAADKAFRQDEAAALKSLQTDLSSYDKTYALARAPFDESRIVGTQTVPGYLAAQIGYWTDEVNAQSTRRSAEALALAAYRTADYAAAAAAVDDAASVVSLPWLDYQAALAQAIATWWDHTGDEDEKANFLALTTHINAAESTYQSSVNGYFVTWAVNTAAAEKTFAIASATHEHQWNADTFAADEAYEHNLAADDETWQIATATNRTALESGLAAHYHTFLQNDDEQARTIADNTSEATRATNDASKDRTFAINESTYSGTWTTTTANCRVTYAENYGSAYLAYIMATTGLDEENQTQGAELAYAHSEAAAAATRAAAIAAAVRDRAVAQADSYADMLDALASTDGTPWSAYDATVAAGNAAYIDDVALALADLQAIEANEQRDYEQSLALALARLYFSQAGATTTRDQLSANAAYDASLIESTADAAAAAAIPLVGLAAARNAVGDGPVPAGGGQADNQNGQGASAGTDSSASSLCTCGDEPERPAGPLPLQPHQPGSIPKIDPPATAASDPRGDFPVIIPIVDSREIPGMISDQHNQFLSRLHGDSLGFHFDPGGMNKVHDSFLHHALLTLAPVDIAKTESSNQTIVIIIIDGAPSPQPAFPAVDKNWTEEDIKRAAAEYARAGYQWPLTAQQASEYELKYLEALSRIRATVEALRYADVVAEARAKERAERLSLYLEFPFMEDPPISNRDNRLEMLRDFYSKYSDNPKAIAALETVLSHYTLRLCGTDPMAPWVRYEVNHFELYPGGVLRARDADGLYAAIANEFESGLPTSWGFRAKKTALSTLDTGVGVLEIVGGVLAFAETGGLSTVVIVYGGNSTLRGVSGIYYGLSGSKSGGVDLGRLAAGGAVEAVGGDRRIGEILFGVSELVVPASFAGAVKPAAISDIGDLLRGLQIPVKSTTGRANAVTRFGRTGIHTFRMRRGAIYPEGRIVQLNQIRKRVMNSPSLGVGLDWLYETGATTKGRSIITPEEIITLLRQNNQADIVEVIIAENLSDLQLLQKLMITIHVVR